MSSKEQGGRRGGRLKLLLTLLLFYVISSVTYYHLPWSIRKRVFEKSAKLDRTLVKSGLSFLTVWDDLGLWGNDCSVLAVDGYADVHDYAGYPSLGFRLIGRTKILENEGYVVGYSDSMRNPLWVAYRVFDVPLTKPGDRPSFRIDKRTRAQVAKDDYTKSGYDRGHMAPNYAIATRYGQDGQRETFLMSNIIPQKPTINRHLWKNLEMKVAKRYGRYFKEVWVITGPVFRDPVKKLKSGVPIPSAYYKIIVDEHEGRLRSLAFLIDTDTPPYTRISSHLVSIDQIEEQTSLDFFPDLSANVQSELESKAAGRLWPWYVPALKYYFSGSSFDTEQ